MPALVLLVIFELYEKSKEIAANDGAIISQTSMATMAQVRGQGGGRLVDLR
jgi:hypothetical protein